VNALDYPPEVAPATGCICAALTARVGVTLPVLSQQVTDRTMDIANRLRFVCGHLSSDELIELATRMAIIEVKYACGWEPSGGLAGV
jgi:hypothetical protein